MSVRRCSSSVRRTSASSFMCSLLRRSCSSWCRLFEVGDLCPQVLGLPLGLDAGPLFLLERAGPRGDFLLCSL